MEPHHGLHGLHNNQELRNSLHRRQSDGLHSTWRERLPVASGERAPIVVCSGNVTDAGEIADGAARLSSLEAVDALWGKPFPDWKDGSLQRSLAEVLAAPATACTARGRGARPASSASRTRAPARSCASIVVAVVL